jgi:hypothetical protein
MSDWTIPPDPRFTGTEYVVDATHEEAFNLWWRFHSHWGVPWEDEPFGFSATIGEIAGRPVAVSVFWCTILGRRIAFIEGTSQLVDYKMIEEWQRAVFPCLKHHGRHSDAANFGNIVSDLGRRLEVDLVRRDPKDIDAAIEAVPLKPLQRRPS